MVAQKQSNTATIAMVDRNGRAVHEASLSATGQTFDVTVGQNGKLIFTPSTVNISVGDTVRWTWASSGHTVTSGIFCPACDPPGGPCFADNKFCSPIDKNCSSGIISNTGAIYSHTFSQAGTFVYFCAVHCDSGMRGVVNVCTPPPAGMVSWWPGNGNGDDVQNGNNVTLFNGAGFAAGMVGQAFNFQNPPNATTGQYAGITSPVGLPLGNSARTLDLWFKTATVSSTVQAESALVEYGVQNTLDPIGGHAFGLILNAPGKLYFYGQGQDLTGTTTIQPNTWYHAAVTYDGSTVTLYLNGQKENSAARLLNTFLDENGLTIGLRPGVSVWNGQIDEVEIFQRALSATEIQNLYDAGSAGKCLPPLLKILSLTRLATNHILLQCLGVPNQINNLQVSADLSPGSFAPILPPPAAADASGYFSYDDAGTVGLAKRFYRLSPP